MKNIRIEKIADMVKKGMIVADIGTDHALLPILLIKQNKCLKVYACDISKGPLESAKRNIEKENCSRYIETLCSNGFENVPSDAIGAVIAGMGYLTAKQILEDAKDRLSSFRQIITEINRDPQLMRQWISDNHYTIDDEAYVYEKGHDYVIISFNTHYHDSYSDEEIEIGPILKDANDTEYLKYLHKLATKCEMILEKSNGNPANKDILVRRNEILKKYL